MGLEVVMTEFEEKYGYVIDSSQNPGSFQVPYALVCQTVVYLRRLEKRVGELEGVLDCEEGRRSW